jgi:multidrug efflux pump subunit AcrA (membrane-fusion protein)
MSRLRKKSSLLILLLLCVLAATGCTLANTPRRSLSELRTALLNHDADAALRYVDVDSIVENMVRDIFLKYEAKSDDPLALLGIEAGRQVAKALMPGVKELAKNRVKAAITSPDEGGYFEYVKKGSVWYVDIAADGDTALVKPRGKSDISFRMKRMADGHWQIVQIIKE